MAKGLSFITITKIIALQVLCICSLLFFSITTQSDTLTAQQTDITELELQQIDQFLIESESKFTDIVEGTEKRVRWYNNQKQKTQFSIVYIHGFSASSQELSPTTQLLADKLGANTYYARLAGHGRSDDAMTQADVTAWQKEALQAYQIGQLLGEKVIIISTSTGGTLATWLLNQSGIKQPFANIMVSPNYKVQNKSIWLLKSSLGLKLAKLINGDYNSFTPHSPEHAKYWTERYPLEAVQPMLKLLDDVKQLDKSKTTTPQFIIYSPTDKVVDVDEIEAVAKQFSNSAVTMHQFTQSTDPYQHVLSGVACSPESTDIMVDVLFSYIESLNNNTALSSNTKSQQ